MPPPLPDHVQKKFEKHRIAEMIREQTYGKVREPVHIGEHAGHRLVAVRNRVYYSKKWKFFSDFLFEYALGRFGKDWYGTQLSLPKEQHHPLYVMRCEAAEYINAQPRLPNGAITPSGTVLACNNFYYDLFTVDDNGHLDDELLARLRIRDQFQGAMHEVFVQATCLRAGFSIVMENEQDPSRRHAEFVAVHKATGQHLLVEAKSRHRAGVLGQPGAEQPHAGIGFQRLIHDAIAKDTTNPLAVFVDTNLRPERANDFYNPQITSPRVIPSRAMASLLDKIRKDNGGLDPYNALVFSNHPQHYERTGIAPGDSRVVGKIATKPRVKIFHPKALEDLLRATALYGVVPTEFPPDRHAH